jgi:hypothetical protein
VSIDGSAPNRFVSNTLTRGVLPFGTPCAVSRATSQNTTSQIADPLSKAVKRTPKRPHTCTAKWDPLPVAAHPWGWCSGRRPMQKLLAKLLTFRRTGGPRLAGRGCVQRDGRCSVEHNGVLTYTTTYSALNARQSKKAIIDSFLGYVLCNIERHWPDGSSTPAIPTPRGRVVRPARRPDLDTQRAAPTTRRRASRPPRNLIDRSPTDLRRSCRQTDAQLTDRRTDRAAPPPRLRPRSTSILGASAASRALRARAIRPARFSAHLKHA